LDRDGAAEHAGVVFVKKLASWIADTRSRPRRDAGITFVFALFPFLFTAGHPAAYLPVKNAIAELMARIDP